MFTSNMSWDDFNKNVKEERILDLSRIGLIREAKLDDLKNAEYLEEDLIPGFNTPPHKVNVGLSGKNVWKNLGFNTTFQWVHGYEWQSTFGTGYVPNYHVWDMQVNYPFDIKASKMIVRLGCSNVLNYKRREVFGGPMIGRMIYTSLGFNLDKPKKQRIVEREELRFAAAEKVEIGQ